MRLLSELLGMGLSHGGSNWGPEILDRESPLTLVLFCWGKDRFLGTSCYQIEEYNYINQPAKNWPCFGSIPIDVGRIPSYPIVFFWLSPQHFFQTHVIAWIIIHNVFFQITFYSTFFWDLFWLRIPSLLSQDDARRRKLWRQTFGSSFLRFALQPCRVFASAANARKVQQMQKGCVPWAPLDDDDDDGYQWLLYNSYIMAINDY